VTDTTKPETPTYWMLRRLKALRDSGIDVTMDDLFSVAEKSDKFLTVEELVDRVEVTVFQRRRAAR
jgi:hypothetical protein